MRPVPPKPAPSFTRHRVGHLARALLVSLVALALTSLIVTMPHAPTPAPSHGATAQGA